MASTQKPVRTIVLDAGPILKNEPSLSVLVAKCEKIFTVPLVVPEVRDWQSRARLQTTLLPFLTIQSPKPESVKFVTDFSRRTGDLAVLSKPDIHVLALAYELECEQNGGDWRLRKLPGQRGPNGSPPQLQSDSLGRVEDAKALESDHLSPSDATHLPAVEERPLSLESAAHDQKRDKEFSSVANALVDNTGGLQLETAPPNEETTAQPPLQGDTDPPEEIPTKSDSESSDSESWITPSNLKRRQEKDQYASTVPISDDKIMQVATITSDFAMQNVLLQIGLNLLSPSVQRVRNIRTYILRCHACFEKVKDMDKQFCPRCGKPTLTRVSCSTNQRGEFKIYLKKNMQWNHRGDRYSIPKPVSGSANGKVGHSRGGGKGGWGQELILTEDQKEYQRAVNGKSRKKETDLMDDDYLPGILTGKRDRAAGRPKIGAGRNVNSKKRVS